MPPEIEYKKVTQSDWQKFKEIRLKGLQTDPQAFGGVFADESQQDDEYWKKRFTDSSRSLFAAEANGNFVGTVGSRDAGDGMWRLSTVYTEPEFRGKGISEKLAMLAIDEAKRKGARIVSLHVNIEQESAVHLYKKMGFEIVRTENMKLGDGLLHDEYYMEKFLR